MSIVQVIKRFLQEEDGVTAIEYGLLAALIAVAIIVSAGLVGTNLDAVFDYIQGKLAGAIPAAG
jgi:pilus assembly protein Flp/PilA